MDFQPGVSGHEDATDVGARGFRFKGGEHPRLVARNTADRAVDERQLQDHVQAPAGCVRGRYLPPPCRVVDVCANDAEGEFTAEYRPGDGIAVWEVLAFE